MNLPDDFWTLYIFVPIVINLVTGLLTIALTVLWVDKKIQEREQKRWDLSKHVLYAKLFRSSTILLDNIIPVSLKGKVKRICLFGNQIPVIYFEYPDFSSDSWYGLSNDEFIRYGKLAFAIKEYVDRFLEDIHAVSSNNNFIVDHKFHANLSILDAVLSLYADDISELKDKETPVTSGAYFEVIHAIMGFRDFLTKEAKTMTKEEYINGIFARKYQYF